MRKLTIAVVLTGVALMPAPAFGHAKTTVLRGEFDFVGADGNYVTGKFGTAQLVDGRRNDKLSVHVRRLGSRQRYVFRLLQSARACEESAPAGTPVRGWTYRRGGELKTSRGGVANGTARSRTFNVRHGVKYFVGVYAGNQLVLCADLSGKRHGHKPKKPPHAPKPHKPKEEHGRGHHEESGHGKPADTPRGRGPRG
jgi:hypothetical protein